MTRTAVKKCVNVKKRRDGTCPDSAFDIFSFGHALFGLTAAGFYLLIAIPIAQQGDYFKTGVIVFSFVVSIGAAVIWEVLEHTIISKKIYIEKLGQKRWCESNRNVVPDIIIVVSMFYVLFVPGLMFITNIIVVVGIIIVLQVLIFFFTWHIKGRC